MESSLDEILKAIKILDVYVCLTGQRPRHTNNDCYRGRATWRGGDGFNVSLDNSRGIWHDFATDDGGGILDLIKRIRGGTRYDALIWASDFTGIPLKENHFTPAERAEWVRAKKELERDLPDALLWKRAVVNMAEDALVQLKAQLFDSFEPPPAVSDIFALEQMLARLRPLGEQLLIEDYRWWRDHHAPLTMAMLRAVKQHEAVENTVLKKFIRSLG